MICVYLMRYWECNGDAICMIRYVEWIGLDPKDKDPNIIIIDTMVGVTIGLGLISLLMDLMFAYFDWLPEPVIHAGWKHFKEISWKKAKINVKNVFSKRIGRQPSSNPNHGHEQTKVSNN